MSEMGRLEEFFGHEEPGEDYASGGANIPGPWSRNYSQAVGAKSPVFTKRFNATTENFEEPKEVPITHVYRGMSHAEWGAALERGYIQSTGRDTILPSEGTNAAVRPSTAEYYVEGNRYMDPSRVRAIGVTKTINGKRFRVSDPELRGEDVMTPLEHAGPQDSSGVIVKLKVHPKDSWTIGHDGYARSPAKIPISRVVKVGAVMGRGHIVPFKGYEASNEPL